VSDRDAKVMKKEAKARAKIEKARAGANARGSVPSGVGVSVRKLDNGSELVVSGLEDAQLERILPQINREVMIALTEERSAFRAGLMRFVREGVFQTIVKVVAGLIVGYLLIRFGVR